jgi:hypothetical protein
MYYTLTTSICMYVCMYVCAIHSRPTSRDAHRPMPWKPTVPHTRLRDIGRDIGCPNSTYVCMIKISTHLYTRTYTPQARANSHLSHRCSRSTCNRICCCRGAGRGDAYMYMSVFSMYVCMYACMYIYLCVCMCVYICVCVFVCVCVCVCVFIHTYNIIGREEVVHMHI